MDLISRQDAINAILAIEDHGNSDRANALGLAECAITTLPSAQQPERNKGRWIVDRIASNIFRCSVCGQDAPVEPIIGVEYKSNFCPHCGAKMIES